MTRDAVFGLLPSNDRRHGTANGYTNYRCRCQPCVNAKRSYERDRRLSKPLKHHRSTKPEAEEFADELARFQSWLQTEKQRYANAFLIVTLDEPTQHHQ